MATSSNIPQLNLKKQFEDHREEFLATLTAVVEKTAFIGGDALNQFEKDFAEWVGGGSKVVGCGNGTDAITLAALALNLPKDSEAIVPAMTYFATAEGLLNAGIKVKLVDVTPDTWLLDLTKLEAAITPRTRLLAPVHLYGQMGEMDALRAFADKHQLKILEDASQSQGAQWKSKPVGYWGDVATYSFYPGKNLGAYGDAGAIQSRDAGIIDTCATLGNHGGRKKYEHLRVGYNSRLDNLQAAILNVKLKYLTAANEARRSVASKYQEALGGINGLTLPTAHASAKHVFHQYVVLVEDRDRLGSFLKENGVDTGVHYPNAIHQLPAMKEHHHLSFPNAERVAAQCLSLPMCPTLTDEQVSYITKTIRSYFGK